MKHLAMAGTYVQIDRDDLERWLDSLSFLHGRAERVQGKAGVYLLPLSDFVAVKLLSTIGSSDDAMGRGMASMQLALVSTVTGQTLNKKAQGQGHFKRTLNWKKTWQEGVERMRDAYMKSQGFYDSIARIRDRDAYKADILHDIEAIPNWQGHNILSDFHATVARGSILTIKQEELLVNTLDAEEQKAKAPPAPVAPKGEDPLIPVLRDMYVRARHEGNQWLMDFAKSVADQLKAGRRLSDKQMDIIDRNRAKYHLASRVAARYIGVISSSTDRV